MYAKQIRFGAVIDGSRINHVGRAVLAGRSIRVFTLADGRKAYAQQDGTVRVDSVGRRDLSAGPVRAARPAELKAAIRDSQGSRRGDESKRIASSRRP